MFANSAMRVLFGGMLATALVCLLSAPTRAQDTGEALFKSKCVMCHGPDGSGKTPMGQALKIPDLHSEEVQKMPETDLKTVIVKGKNKMPAYESKLTQAQIEKLAEFIHALSKH